MLINCRLLKKIINESSFFSFFLSCSNYYLGIIEIKKNFFVYSELISKLTINIFEN